jgi:RNA polymerase sigma factor (sigma-70 family)
MATPPLEVVLQHLQHLADHRPSEQCSDGELLRAFVTRNDAGAFEILVRRHGAMVLRLCQRLLGNVQDAEDACQATFLLLAQHPQRVRKRESLASWLHGVAYRMAADTRRAAGRRRKHEQQAAAAQPTDPAQTAALRDLQATVEEEIAGLPDKARELFLLCCVEQQSCAEVASRLGQQEGTVRNRLTQARKLLRQRLARRGIVLTAALTVSSLSTSSSQAALPAPLVRSTVQAAADVVVGRPLTRVLVSEPVIELVEGAKRTMGFTTTRLVVLLLVAGALLGAGVGWAALQGVPAQPQTPQVLPLQPPAERTSEKARAEPKKEDVVELRGRVLDPDGKPQAGAAVIYLTSGKNEENSPQGMTGPDGRFPLPVARAELGRFGHVVANARGFGADWATVRETDKEADYTLRLVPDDVALTGRILNLEGKPVAGVTVQVAQVGKATDGDLEAWVKKSVKWLADHDMILPAGLDSVSGMALHLAPVTTDREGRFRLTGVGRNRAVVLDIGGGGVERRRVWAVTLQRPPAELTGVVGLYGPAFEHLAGPAKPVGGVVTDKVTGKPLAGVRVSATVPRPGFAPWGDLETVTDDKGQFLLDALPKGKKYFLTVRTPEDKVYLPQERSLDDTEGLLPLRTEFALVPGSVVEGRMFDRETGKPIRGTVRYFPLPGNAQFEEVVSSKMGNELRAPHSVGEDGTFRLVVFPGPGVICAYGDPGPYRQAKVPEEDARRGVGRMIATRNQGLSAMVPMGGPAYRIIDPGEKPETLKMELKLTKGRNVSGAFVSDKEGETGLGQQAPIRYAAWKRVDEEEEDDDDAPRVFINNRADIFKANSLVPDQRYLFIFYQPDKKRAGYAEVKEKGMDTLNVRLLPWATAQGRVLSVDGRPVAGATVQVVQRDNKQLSALDMGPLAKPGTCDDKGQFQLEGLVPGLTFELMVRLPGKKDEPGYTQAIAGGAFKPGEARNIGVVTVKGGKKE